MGSLQNKGWRKLNISIRFITVHIVLRDYMDSYELEDFIKPTI